MFYIYIYFYERKDTESKVVLSKLTKRLKSLPIFEPNKVKHERQL